MSRRPIIDAGPGLNFLSINKERLLIDVLGRLSAPETVQAEVLRKSWQDERFRAAAVLWRKLTPNWIQILSDDHTPELAAVVHRIAGQPMEERRKQSKDLGEIMVIAHAVVAAEAGETVTVLSTTDPEHASPPPKSADCKGSAPKAALSGRSDWQHTSCIAQREVSTSLTRPQCATSTSDCAVSTTAYRHRDHKPPVIRAVDVKATRPARPCHCPMRWHIDPIIRTDAGVFEWAGQLLRAGG